MGGIVRPVLLLVLFVSSVMLGSYLAAEDRRLVEALSELGRLIAYIRITVLRWRRYSTRSARRSLNVSDFFRVLRIGARARAYFRRRCAAARVSSDSGSLRRLLSRSATGSAGCCRSAFFADRGMPLRGGAYRGGARKTARRAAGSYEAAPLGLHRTRNDGGAAAHIACA